MATDILRPNGNGYYTEFPTSVPSTHYLAVDEVSQDGDSSYIESSGQVSSLRPFLRLNNTDSFGTYEAQTTSYAEYSQVISRPGGGSWTPSDIDSLEVGIEEDSVTYKKDSFTLTDFNRPSATVNSVTVYFWSKKTTAKLPNSRVTQVYIVVDYTDSTPTTETITIASNLIPESGKVKRLVSESILDNTLLSNIANNISPYKLVLSKIGSKVSFEPLIETIYRPTNDYSHVGDWLPYPDTPPTYYDKVDEVVQSGSDYVKCIPNLDDYISFYNNSFDKPAGGKAIKVTSYNVRMSAAYVKGKMFIEYAGVKHYGSEFWFYGSPYTTYSYTWDYPPWGSVGDQWPNISQIKFGVQVTYLGGSGSIRIGQIYLSVIGDTGFNRISDILTLDAKGLPNRLTNNAIFQDYNPDWWDTDYYRRQKITFDTIHSTFNVGDVVQLEKYTGYEEIVDNNCVFNEGVEHSSKQAFYYKDANNEELYVSWLGYYPGSSWYYIYLKVYDYNTQTWSATKAVTNSGTTYDTHFYPWVLVTSDRIVHLFYGAHNSYIKHIANITPGDIDNWTSVVNIAPGGTYPRALQLNNGDIFLWCRGIGSNYGWGSFYTSSDGGVTWSGQNKVVDYTNNYGGNPSVYCGGVNYVNGIIHIVFTFHDWYGSDNKSRAICYIYSPDNGNTWYNVDGIYIGSTNSDYVNYNDINFVKVIESGNPWPTTGPFYHTNSDSLVIDADGHPSFVFMDWMTSLSEENNIYFARHDGTQWNITNLSALPSAKKMMRYRQGGVLYVDSGVYYVYILALPDDANARRFGGELYRFTSNDGGSTWQYQYVTKNTKYGAGQINVLPNVPNGRYRLLFYVRGVEVCILEDKTYSPIRSDGEDVRIVRQSQFNGVTQSVELDRIPDRFFAIDTQVEWKLDKAVKQNNQNIHPYDSYWLYFTNYNPATQAKDDVTNIHTYYESFEQDKFTTGSPVAGIDGWTGDTEFLAVRYSDTATWGSAHTNKLYSGAQFLYINSSSGPKIISRTLTIDNHTVEFHVWKESGGGNIYVELYDSVSGKYVRLGHYGSIAQYISDTSYNGPSIKSNRYNNFKLKVYNNHVYASCNDVIFKSYDGYIGTFTHLRIGFEATSATIFVLDELDVKPYINILGSVYLGTSEGSTNYDISRISSDADLAYYRDLTISNLAKSEKFYYNKLSSNTIVDKNSVIDIASSLKLDRATAVRIADLIIGEKSSIKSISSYVDIEDNDILNIANNLVVDVKTITSIANNMVLDMLSDERLNNFIVGDKNEIDSITSKLTLDEYSSKSLTNILYTNKYLRETIANIVKPEIATRLKVSNAITSDKVISDKLSNKLNLDASNLSSISNTINIEYDDLLLIASILVVEYHDIERLSNKVNLTYERFVRILHEITSDKLLSNSLASDVPLTPVGLLRLVSDTTLQSTYYISISSDLTNEGSYFNRLVNSIVIESYDYLSLSSTTTIESFDIISLSNDLLLNNRSTISISSSVDTDKSTIESINSDVKFKVGEYIKIASDISTEAIFTYRAAHNVVLLLKDVITQLSNILSLDKSQSTRLFSIILPNKHDFMHFANNIDVEGLYTNRISNEALLYKSYLFKLASDIILSKTVLLSIVNDLDLYKFDLLSMSNIAKIQSSLLSSIANSLNLTYTEAVELANMVNLTGHIVFRIYNSVLLRGLVKGILLVPVSLDTIGLNNPAVDTITGINEVLEVIGIKNSNISTCDISNEKLEDIKTKGKIG